MNKVRMKRGKLKKKVVIDPMLKTRFNTCNSCKYLKPLLTDD